MTAVTALRSISTQETLLIARKIQHVIQKQLNFAEAMADLKKFEQLIDEYDCDYDRSRSGAKRAETVLIDAVDETIGESFPLEYSKSEVVKYLRNQLGKLSNNEEAGEYFQQFIVYLIESLEQIPKSVKLATGTR